MKEKYTPPLGDRYSQLFVGRGKPLFDSERMRIRVGGVFNKYNKDKLSAEVARYIKIRLGVKVIWNGYWRFEDFYEKCELRDLLDAVSVVSDFLIDKTLPQSARYWCEEVNSVFIEENLPYRVVDSLVKPHVDQAFDVNQRSLLIGLNGQGLGAVKAEVENAYINLRSENIDTKTAVRSMYDGIESYLKLKFDFSALGVKVIRKFILPQIEEIYKEDELAKKSLNQLMNGLGKWVDGMQQYRHGQGTEDSLPPPFELAVLLIDQGASYLRWLMELLEEKEN